MNKYDRIKKANAFIQFVKFLKKFNGKEFSIEWVKRCFPNRFSLQPSNFHIELCKILNNLIYDESFNKICISAPRGSAKSTYSSFALPIYCIFNRPDRFRYIVILSDSFDQAKKFLQDIRYSLESFCHKANTRQIILKNNVCIEALGSGCRIRGRRFLQFRPDLIIVDDAQSNQDMLSEVEREKSFEWFTREVLPAGSTRCKYLVIGTMLHPDCILGKLEKIPGWVNYKFKALEFPENVDAWKNWYLSYRLSNNNERENLLKYLSDNKEFFEKGGKSIWPEKWSVSDLMRLWLDLGESVFATEYQQESSFSLIGAYFSEDIVRTSIISEVVNPNGFIIRFQGCDPSAAKTDTSDFTSHIWGGLTKEGRIVVWSYSGREKNFIDRILYIAKTFQPNYLVIEENATLNLLVNLIHDKLKEMNLNNDITLVSKYWNIPKQVRIKYLTTYLNQGLLKICEHPLSGIEIDNTELIHELYQWPKSKHDDAIDCLSSTIFALSKIISI